MMTDVLGKRRSIGIITVYFPYNPLEKPNDIYASWRHIDDPKFFLVTGEAVEKNDVSNLALAVVAKFYPITYEADGETVHGFALASEVDTESIPASESSKRDIVGCVITLIIIGVIIILALGIGLDIIRF